MAQVVELEPSKSKALSSNHNTTKKKKRTLVGVWAEKNGGCGQVRGPRWEEGQGHGWIVKVFE
jgi:hypothetical protein